MRDHPDGRAFRAVERLAFQRKTRNQQARLAMHQLLFGHRQPIADKRGVIRAVEIVRDLDGVESDDVVEHPAFVGITFRDRQRIALHPLS